MQVLTWRFIGRVIPTKVIVQEVGKGRAIGSAEVTKLLAGQAVESTSGFSVHGHGMAVRALRFAVY